MVARRVAVVNDVADVDVFLVVEGDRHILIDYRLHLALDGIQRDDRLFLKAEHKAVLDVGVLIILRAAVGQDVTGDILGGVDHLAVTDRLKDDVGNVLRHRAKQVRPGDDDLLADAEHQVGVDRQLAALSF